MILHKLINALNASLNLIQNILLIYRLKLKPKQKLFFEFIFK